MKLGLQLNYSFFRSFRAGWVTLEIIAHYICLQLEGYSKIYNQEDISLKRYTQINPVANTGLFLLQ